MRPVGLVLAGGRGLRLGGGDKPLRLLQGRPILSHVADRLAPQCTELVLSGNGDPARFTAWDWPVVADHGADAGCGPLAGLLAGLDWVATHRAAARSVLSMPGDTPFLPPDLAARLVAARPENPDAVVVARSAGHDHPLAALWPVSIRGDLRRMLRSEGMRRVRDVLRRRVSVAVDWPTAPIDPFFNINTPADLAVAEAWLAGAMRPPDPPAAQGPG